MTMLSPLPVSMARKSGSFIFLSGQLALQDGEVVGDDVTAQTHFVIDAIKRELGQFGLGLGDVVRTGVWLSRGEDFAAFNTAYAMRFSPPFPTRSTVISALALPYALVEIDAIAEVRA